MLDSGHRCLYVGVKLQPLSSCLVEQKTPRAIHYPSLLTNCPDEICSIPHHSYAIPVRVNPLENNLAQLLLEINPGEINNRTAEFLLNHYPELKMASAATSPSATTPSSGGRSPEDDIAAIAKQISDHAEAIYQTWKSRGLAPQDILTCHSSETAADRFGNVLTPQPRPQIITPKPVVTPKEVLVDRFGNVLTSQRQPQVVPSNSVPSPPIDLLAQAPTMDNNRLERLVSNFVTEDKARLAAARTNKPSSIQYALQKFEKNSVSDKIQALQPQKVQPITPKVQPQVQSPIQTQSSPIKPVQKPQISPKPRFPPAETIEFTLPPDISPNLNSWPLKNRLVSTDTVKQRTLVEKSATLDEVALEEKRLINALKNGVVLSSEDRTDHRQNGVAKIPNEVIVNSNNTRWGPRTIKRPEQTQNLPHPELTTTQRQHLRQVQTSSPNPVRPFLTRGSVAERVLIFERCPSELLLDKRIRAPTAPKIQAPAKQLPPHTTLQRHVKANRNVLIPRFYYPQGKPLSTVQLESIKQHIQTAFVSTGERITREQFLPIVQACELPTYWKIPLFLAAGGDSGFVTKDKFMTFWNQMCSQCHDAASRFVYVCTRGRRNWLCPEDFIPLIQDVVETHPGLTFLKEAAEFHSRYVHTVIARIFYCVNRSWSGRITLSELRRSNLLSTIQLLEEEEDINQITAYFSYEHFYVIYCKFWELDRDHDLFIDKTDLTRHNDHALSTRIIDRIFSGAVTRGQHKAPHEEKMSYTEFVWFLLSEEDKTHPTAIEYWFRCMDLDGDGFLSMYELEYFYEEQMHRMEAIGIETLPFQDCLCQMLDMVKPTIPGKISLSDLKKCKMTPIFFDTFFNLEKYLDHEQRDPFATQRDHDSDGQEMSDWDRYAAEEYELLVAEEGNDQQDSISLDERQDDEDLLSPNLDVILNDVFEPTVVNGKLENNDTSNQLYPSDDEGDYAPDSDDCSI